MAESETPRTDGLFTDVELSWDRGLHTKVLFSRMQEHARTLERELHLKDQKIAEAEARAESLQSQLAAAQEALDKFQHDPHTASKRPCETCLVITKLTGRLFHCYTMQSLPRDFAIAATQSGEAG